MSAGIEIAPVKADAADGLAAVHATAFEDNGQSWSAAAFADLLAMPGAMCWQARTGQDIAGFVLARLGGGECEIITVGVISGCRRRGVGGALLTTVLEAALAVQAPVILEVAEDNAAARALYARAGFQEAGRRRNYYDRPTGGVDALILRWEPHTA